MDVNGNILIVDDNPNNLQVLLGLLGPLGYKVRPALSGEIALRAIETSLPDLILLDVRMPGIDGYETCRQLKANDNYKDIPVIFISALNDIEDKLVAFDAGAVDYIIKPFQSPEVLARVRTQMELAKARKALVETSTRLEALMEHMVQAEKLKSLGFLAAGVAHELNTPIGNAMMGASTIEDVVEELYAAISGPTPQPEIDELITICRNSSEIVQRNLNRAGKLIRSLKEVTVDGASERRCRINLRETVDNLISVMSILRKAPYTITVDIEPKLFLDTYPGHLEQILDNLIQNSIIHGFDGANSGTIKISAHSNNDDNITMTIADDGKGITPLNAKRVFDPFFTTRLGQGGSGLGLHISYNLATGKLGGKISVASENETGTVFTLILPMIAPYAEEPLFSEQVITSNIRSP